jgi:hypothetical protein
MLGRYCELRGVQYATGEHPESECPSVRSRADGWDTVIDQNKASKLAREAFDLWQAGKLDESVAKYQQARCFLASTF